MCGIVGYVGGQDATHVVVEGLRRLEYRGYDSAGVAVVTPEGVRSRKRAGKLANLEKALAESPLPDTTVGIGHTRWATHGAPNDINAHPHLSEDGSLAVIHNGIIENFAELRSVLQADGVQFLSETDTEVAAHLLAKMVAQSASLTEAMQRTCQQLRGAFQPRRVAVVDRPLRRGAVKRSPDKAACAGCVKAVAAAAAGGH